MRCLIASSPTNLIMKFREIIVPMTLLEMREEIPRSTSLETVISVRTASPISTNACHTRASRQLSIREQEPEFGY